jgi:folate-binding protein YgfZ
MSERTPYHEAASNAGAVFAEYAGWLIPADYGRPELECQQVQDGAAFFDISHHGMLLVTGNDAASFLHNLCTNEVLRLPIGAGCEAFLTTGQAKIVGHAFINHVMQADRSDAFWVEVGAGMAKRVLDHLNRYLIAEQVELADQTRHWALLHLAGTRAAAVLDQALREPLRELSPLEQFQSNLGDVTVFVRQHDRLGFRGYDLLTAREDAPIVWPALREAGAQPAGMRAYDTLRIEAGTPCYGLDIDETNLPQEVGRMEQAVSFTKGCYIGQETIARIRTYGHVNRSLVGLRVNGAVPVPHGAKVFHAGKEVGHVTSSVYSPALVTVIALAYIRRGANDVGISLELELGAARQSAVVTSLPFRSPGPA